MVEIIHERNILHSITELLAYIFSFLNGLFFTFILIIILNVVLQVIIFIIQKQFNFENNIKIIALKLGSIIYIVFSLLIDYILTWITQKLGLHFTTNGLFSIATTCYLIAAEGFILLDNLKRLGVPEIPFLGKALRKLQEGSKKMIGDE